MKRPGPGSLKRPMRYRVLALGGVSAVAQAVALDHYRMATNRGSIWRAAGFGATGKDWTRWSTPSPPLVSAEKVRP